MCWGSYRRTRREWESAGALTLCTQLIKTLRKNTKKKHAKLFSLPFRERDFIGLGRRAVRRRHQIRRREGVERYRLHARVVEDEVGQRRQSGILVLGAVGVVVAVSDDSPVQLFQKYRLHTGREEGEKGGRIQER